MNNYSTLGNNTSKAGAWSVTMCFVLAMAAIMVPDIAAATTATGNPNENNIALVLCNVIIILQGNIARGIAAGGVIFLGFSLFLGKISWGTAMALGIGLGAIFGAQQIVNMASGSAALDCTGAEELN
jgi:type IV secretory pathway VirB2 component (pilin)